MVSYWYPGIYTVKTDKYFMNCQVGAPYRQPIKETRLTHIACKIIKFDKNL